MHVRWTSLGRQEGALTSVCWGMAIRPEPAAAALDSAWAAMANPAKVSKSTGLMGQCFPVNTSLQSMLDQGCDCPLRP